MYRGALSSSIRFNAASQITSRAVWNGAYASPPSIDHSLACQVNGST